MVGPDSTLLVVLEFIGIILSGAFGVLGLLGDFRDKRTGALTRYGRIALAVIVLSSSIAAAAQTLRTIREHHASELQSQKTDETLAEVKRGLHPLENVFATFWVTLPLDDNLMKDYRDRLAANLDTFATTQPAPLQGLPNLAWVRAGLLPSRQSRGGAVEQVSIGSDSPFAPQRASEMTAAEAVAWGDFRLEFYRKPRTLASHPSLHRSLGIRPDLGMWFNSALGPIQRPAGNHVLEYTLSPHALSLHASRLPTERSYWQNNGQVVSSDDFPDSQLVVHLTGFRSSPFNDGEALRTIRSQFKLQTLTLSVGSGQEYLFRGEQFQLARDEDGYPVYFLTVPTTLNGR